MRNLEIYKKVAELLGITQEQVSKIYTAYWRFIKNNIQALPLKQDLSEEEFEKLDTSFSIPYLGKLNCTYKRYIGTKKFRKYKQDIILEKYDECNRNTTNV